MREQVELLEHEADAGAQMIHVELGVVHVLAIE